MHDKVDVVLFVVACLLLASVLASKLAAKLGVPSLILFMAVGMIAGSEGLGGIYFDNVQIAEAVGTVALSFILFSGGMDTDWTAAKPLLGRGLALSTVGAAVTAASVGFFAHWALGVTLLEGLLLGAIVSSTDAAAVFGTLRARALPIKKDIPLLLELESGTNDPLAVFMTVTIIGLIQGQPSSPWTLVLSLVWQMALGAFFGLVLGYIAGLFLRRVKLELGALGSVVSIATMMFAYGGTSLIGGNGFLAVYVAGFVLGQAKIDQHETLCQFHEGVAWLMQIAMFLVLGLLVFPSRLMQVAWQGVIVAAFLMFIARPLGTFLSLAFFKVPLPTMTFVSWAGLRGAVPIVLATFPRLAGLPRADELFNIVFFVVLLSAVLQGSTLAGFAKRLKLTEQTVG